MQKASWQDIKGSKVLVGSYDEAVKMMGDMTFLSALTRFPKEAINDETVELLMPYFSAPDFTFDAAKKVGLVSHPSEYHTTCKYGLACTLTPSRNSLHGHVYVRLAVDARDASPAAASPLPAMSDLAVLHAQC